MNPVPIDVVRPTTTSALTTVADVATVVTVAALVTWLSTLLAAADRDPPWLARDLRRIVLVGATVSFGLRAWSVFDVVGGVGPTITSRRVLVQGLLVVLVLVVALVQDDRTGLRHRERRAATAVLGSLAAGAVVLAGPRAGGVTELATTAAVLVGATVVAAIGRRVLRGRVDGGERWPTTVLLVLAVAAVGWPAVAVPSTSTSFEEQLVLGDAELLVTLAPAQPGSNEAHVYVFGDDGALLPVRSVRVAVDGGAGVELYSAGPGHLVALSLPLDDADSWAVDLEATMADGRTLVARTEVPRGG